MSAGSSNVVKVMIIRPGALGDTLMLVPALAQISLSAKVFFVGRYPAIDFVRAYAEECFNYEAPGWHRLFMKEPGEESTLPVADPDLVAAFLKDPEQRARENLKLFYPTIPIHVFSPFPPEGEKKHVALYLGECLQRAGCPVNLSDAFKNALCAPLFEAKPVPSFRNSTVFHPGSGGKDKNYSPDFWVRLILAFADDPFLSRKKHILLLGPAEEPLHSFFREKLKRKWVEILFSPNRDTLLSLLGSAALYVGHDSGITHLSAMLGTLTLALFKNTDVSQWRPLGPAVVVIQKQEGSDRLIRKIVAEATGYLSRHTNSSLALDPPPN